MAWYAAIYTQYTVYNMYITHAVFNMHIYICSFIHTNIYCIYRVCILLHLCNIVFSGVYTNISVSHVIIHNIIYARYDTQ